MSKGAYTIPGRLSDVLALIQMLALDKHIHRSEDGIKKELQGNPSSSNSWTELAMNHPEFFRVRREPDREHVMALVARHVIASGETETDKREMPSDLIHKLIETAIDLHDRQISAAELWKSFMPLWAALIGGIFGTLSVLVTLWVKGCPR